MPSRAVLTAYRRRRTGRSQDLFRPPQGRLRRPKPDAPKSIANRKNNPKSCMDAKGRIRSATAIGKSKGSRAIFDSRLFGAESLALPRVQRFFKFESFRAAFVGWVAAKPILQTPPN